VLRDAVCANDVCGAVFVPSRAWQKFCCPACRASHHQTLKPDRVIEIGPNDKTILLVVKR